MTSVQFGGKLRKPTPLNPPPQVVLRALAQSAMRLYEWKPQEIANLLLAFGKLMSERIPPGAIEEAMNRPNIDRQEKFPRGILRGLGNLSETP